MLMDTSHTPPVGGGGGGEVKQLVTSKSFMCIVSHWFCT